MKIMIFELWHKAKKWLISYRCECGIKLYKENTYEEVVDTISGIVCEKEVRCKNCNKLVGYWAYGGYEPPVDKREEFIMHISSLKYEISKIFKEEK